MLSVFIVSLSVSMLSVCDSDKLNKESVRMIETGLFSLCLDSPVMRISDEKYAQTRTHTNLVTSHNPHAGISVFAKYVGKSTVCVQISISLLVLPQLTVMKFELLLIFSALSIKKTLFYRFRLCQVVSWISC